METVLLSGVTTVHGPSTVRRPIKHTGTSCSTFVRWQMSPAHVVSNVPKHSQPIIASRDPLISFFHSQMTRKWRVMIFAEPLTSNRWPSSTTCNTIARGLRKYRLSFVIFHPAYYSQSQIIRDSCDTIVVLLVGVRDHGTQLFVSLIYSRKRTSGTWCNAFFRCFIE